MTQSVLNLNNSFLPKVVKLTYLWVNWFLFIKELILICADGVNLTIVDWEFVLLVWFIWPLWGHKPLAVWLIDFDAGGWLASEDPAGISELGAVEDEFNRRIWVELIFIAVGGFKFVGDVMIWGFDDRKFDEWDIEVFVLLLFGKIDGVDIDDDDDEAGVDWFGEFGMLLDEVIVLGRISFFFSI